MVAEVVCVKSTKSCAPNALTQIVAEAVVCVKSTKSRVLIALTQNVAAVVVCAYMGYLDADVQTQNVVAEHLFAQSMVS